jgi:1-deoxy-D-xylulose-5-phosphate synthase
MLYTAMEVAEAIDATVVNMRFVKPLDEDLLKTIASSHDGIVLVEDSCVMGGAGSACLEYLADQGIAVSALQIGLPDQFTEHGDIPSLMELYGISAKQIEARVRTRFAIEACTTAP